MSPGTGAMGVENAAKINASGSCFEDYIAALQQIGLSGKALVEEP